MYDGAAIANKIAMMMIVTNISVNVNPAGIRRMFIPKNSTQLIFTTFILNFLRNECY
jgi:hypothetical protein